MILEHPWPVDLPELRALQERLAALTPEPWTPLTGSPRVGGVWFAAPTGSEGMEPGEPAWAAAVVLGGRSEEAVVRGVTAAGYVAGALALREGPLLETAVRALPRAPDVLLVNATGRDHPCGAGLATHLGAVLDVPTVGVTDRPLLASGPEPEDVRWATSALLIEGSLVAVRLRTRAGVRPVVVHPAWRTDLGTAVEVARAAVGAFRTPEPLRLARRAARLERARDEDRSSP